MEIELKYAIKDDGTADLIWKDLELREMEEQDSRETEEFKGIYYDTADHVLFKNDIARRLLRR
ncbi:MAG: hypothetical protein RR661_02730 [Anaerovoracaceae bacterium]